MSRTIPAALVAIALAAACGEARQTVARGDAVSCVGCHGRADDPTGAPSQGAHAAHVQSLSGELACRHCHPDPRAGSTSHMNRRVDVVFSSLATDDGALPSRFDEETLACSAVYCHGAFPGGNSDNAPVWTSVGQGQGACGTCHDLAAAATHGAVPPDRSGCVGCHETTIDATGDVITGGTHVDGRVNWRRDACASCHAGVTGGGAPRSSHLSGVPNPGSGCPTCHGASQEPGGHPPLTGSDAECAGCHDGAGEAIGTRTPPLLVGWTAPSGDFHGARVGTGQGGTLRAPYERGQGPLPCTACHDAHASANAFLLAGTVNGTAIPAGAINRAGVGAEILCVACHEGDRHQPCLACHETDPKPAGSPCFWCHGHEGITNLITPDPAGHGTAGNDCHCHDQRSPPAFESVPPRITSATGQIATPKVSGITATSATIRWWTNEGATSYVEYGIGAAGSVTGSYDLVYQHVVTLTGLEPSTTYVWRVRTSDQFRNVTRSALESFDTPGVDDVPRPDLAGARGYYAETGTYTVVATLVWYPVTAPSGTAVEYQVQLASDPEFTFLDHADLARGEDGTGYSAWIPGFVTDDADLNPGFPLRPARSFDVTVTDLPQDLNCPAPPPEPNLYWFRVRARDQAGKVSEWSAPAQFGALAIDPWC